MLIFQAGVNYIIKIVSSSYIIIVSYILPLSIVLFRLIGIFKTHNLRENEICTSALTENMMIKSSILQVESYKPFEYF